MRGWFVGIDPGQSHVGLVGFKEDTCRACEIQLEGVIGQKLERAYSIIPDHFVHSDITAVGIEVLLASYGGKTSPWATAEMGLISGAIGLWCERNKIACALVPTAVHFGHVGGTNKYTTGYETKMYERIAIKEAKKNKHILTAGGVAAVVEAWWDKTLLGNLSERIVWI